jgi:hypothetical protein
MSLHLLAIEPDLLAIDPRPCQLCGLTIDRHEMIDCGEGPEFFCLELPPDEMTLIELERRAELRRQEEVAAMVEQWERADPRDCWKHTGKTPPPTEVRNSPMKAAPPAAPEPYRPAASTVDAFWFVVGLRDPERFKAWLADRPKDAPFLLQLLETK